MVTCLAIGDPHFMVNNTIDAEELIKKVNLLVQKHKPTFVVILGDLLHTHEKVHVLPYKLATKFIRLISRQVPLYLIIGNHDLINCSQHLTDNHAFNAFKDMCNVTVCDRPIIKKIGGLKFVFCPYVAPSRFEEALDTLHERGKAWDDAECIFAHQEFYGCSYNPVATSVVGDVWPENYPMVVSGHIHNEQRLQENIYYVGSSMQHAFGESGQKIVALLTFKTGKPFRLQRIDLKMKRKKTIYLDITDIDDFKEPENCYLRLVLKGTPEEFKVFRKGKTFKKLLERGIKVCFAPQITEIVKRDLGNKKSVIEILGDLVEKENKHVKRVYHELLAES